MAPLIKEEVQEATVWENPRRSEGAPSRTTAPTARNDRVPGDEARAEVEARERRARTSPANSTDSIMTEGAAPPVRSKPPPTSHERSLNAREKLVAILGRKRVYLNRGVFDPEPRRSLKHPEDLDLSHDLWGSPAPEDPRPDEPEHPLQQEIRDALNISTRLHLAKLKTCKAMMRLTTTINTLMHLAPREMPMHKLQWLYDFVQNVKPLFGHPVTKPETLSYLEDVEFVEALEFRARLLDKVLDLVNKEIEKTGVFKQGGEQEPSR